MFIFSNDFVFAKLSVDTQLYTVSKMAEAENVNDPPYHKTTFMCHNADLCLLYMYLSFQRAKEIVLV